MEAALASVSIAVVLAVHTHSFIFTRTFCHPGFNLANKGIERHGQLSSLRHRGLGPSFLPQIQGPDPASSLRHKGPGPVFLPQT